MSLGCGFGLLHASTHCIHTHHATIPIIDKYLGRRWLLSFHSPSQMFPAEKVIFPSQLIGGEPMICGGGQACAAEGVFVFLAYGVGECSKDPRKHPLCGVHEPRLAAAGPSVLLAPSMEEGATTSPCLAPGLAATDAHGHHGCVMAAPHCNQ